MSKYKIPIKQRPPGNYVFTLARTLSFNAVFQLGMLGLHFVQLLFIPLPYIAADATQQLFARLLVLITAVWAPTTLRVYVDSDDDILDLRKIVRRDGSTGRVIGLDLPDRMVMISNHQVYCDWSYIWNLLYFSSHASHVIIILKASLKWIPLVGPAMQLFNFIFISRSWAVDRSNVSNYLKSIMDKASRTLTPLCLLVFPEGTLVSPLTRPTSRAFAEKTGVEDLNNLLLPRSTGLLFCLQHMLPRLGANLYLLDATVAYPGIPRGGYGQDYYTLQSIFSAGVPPPVIHVHLRAHRVKYDLPPIGSDTVSEEQIKVSFDKWLQESWRGKDKRLDTFLDSQTLASSDKDKANFVDIPITFKSTRDVVELSAVSILGLWLLKWFSIFTWRLLRRIILG